MNLQRYSWFLLAIAGCRPATGGIGPAADPCHIPSETAEILDTVTIALSEGASDAESVRHRLTHRTLIRVDCMAHVRPALARRWSRDSSGTVWTFELDTVVPAGQVIAQWEAGRTGGIWPWSRILQVAAAGESRIEVRLDSAYSDVPTAFALPQLAVVTAVPTSVMPVLRVQTHSSAVDERDLLDQSPGPASPAIDLLLTRNPGVIGYAGSKPGWRVISLAWDRTYVAVAPVTRPTTGSGDESQFRASLARDVVRAESRAAEGPFWWEAAPCRGTTPLTAMGRQPLVAYPEGDATARELAERLVALQRPSLRAVGLPPSAFNASLAGGGVALYVLPVSRGFPGTCARLSRWPAASHVIPLVDTRAHALVRVGVPAFNLDSDGGIRFDRQYPLLSAAGPEE